MQINWIALFGDCQFAPEVAGLVNDQSVVGDGLFRPGLVFGQVAAAVLLRDIEETRGAVVGEDFIAVVVEQQAEFVEMAVAHSLGSRLQHSGLGICPVPAAQHRQTATPSFRPVAEQPGAECIGYGFPPVERPGESEPIAIEDKGFLPPGDGQQLGIASQSVGDGDTMAQLHGVEALVLDRVVDWEKQAVVGKVDAGIDRLEQDAVAIGEDFALRFVRLDAAGEQQKRHQGVALVVGPLAVVAVG